MKERKKGFSLYELVLAAMMAALLAASVISFSVYLSRFTARRSERNEVLAEYTLIRRMSEQWFSAVDDAESVFSVEYGYSAWFPEEVLKYDEETGKVVTVIERRERRFYTLSVRVADGRTLSVRYLPESRELTYEYPDGSETVRAEHFAYVSVTGLAGHGVYAFALLDGSGEELFRFTLGSRL